MNMPSHICIPSFVMHIHDYHNYSFPLTKLIHIYSKGPSPHRLRSQRYYFSMGSTVYLKACFILIHIGLLTVCAAQAVLFKLKLSCVLRAYTDCAALWRTPFCIYAVLLVLLEVTLYNVHFPSGTSISRCTILFSCRAVRDTKHSCIQRLSWFNTINQRILS